MWILGANEEGEACMKEILGFLRKPLAPFLESRLFEILFSLTMLAAPVGVGAQLYRSVFAEAATGISVEMYSVFFFMYLVILLYGIKEKDSRIFLPLLISWFESIAIIIVVLARGGTWFGFGVAWW
jgi:hypothetical protein